MKDRLIDGYLAWLRPHDYFDNYQQLLIGLNDIKFIHHREMDLNQIKHAEEMREKVAKQYDIHYNYFLPVSALEVMLSLADRFSTVLFVPGDQQAEGFADILELFFENLGINVFDDDNYDAERVKAIILRWMNLEYNRDGTKGNIVCKPGYTKLKSLDMWMQLHKVLVTDYNESVETFPVKHPYVE